MRVDESLGAARVTFDGQRLTATTGEMRREWVWTGKGLVTTTLVNLSSGRSWCAKSPAYACDWTLPGLEGEDVVGQLVALWAREGDDEGFTSPHIEVVAEIAYPAAEMDVHFMLWVYPDSPGMRTRLWVRGREAYCYPHRADATLRLDHVPVAFGRARRHMLGLHNNTQRRNDAHLDILHEATVDRPLAGPEWCDWCSALCIEEGPEGLALVKESHKCVNQPGHDTGFFKCDPATGVDSAGWGLLPQEIDDTRYRGSWGSWCLVYSGGPDERELALKRFGRIRYPVDLARDAYIMANTWGSGTRRPGERGRDFASEEIVLREIDSQADLGIDVQQIDDGWQTPPDAENWTCERWLPHPERYPEGWRRVVERAREKGVTLGLWAPATAISLEDLQANYEQGGFRYYKLDFARLQSRDEIDALMSKVRAFVRAAGHQVRINWDVTEPSPRYGYFFAREYGLLYLENRKPVIPPTTVYRPHTVLRDAWQVSKYINLNKVQISVQNVDRVDRERSDAALHSHAYCVAITLMAAPLFFQLTQLYSAAARDQIRPLLAAYKAHRDPIYRGTVFPIGAKPDNASWTGFQCFLPGQEEGYLTLFRELYNDQPETRMRLRFVSGTEIELHNLLTGERARAPVEQGGWVRFEIGAPADFRFYRYAVRRG